MEESINNPLIPDKVYKSLPDILKKATDNFSGREKDIVLTSALGVLSSVIPRVSGYYDGSIVYSNLYFIVCAPAASGKGVLMKAKILIDKVHDKIFDESINQWNKTESDDLKDKENSKKVFLGPVLKIIPANTSTAQLYEMMNNADDSILMIESEADTMGNMLGNEWSNYSDVLRKGFHHEQVSLSRKSDGKFISVKNPKLSIVLSGTPAQLKSIINSKENGLLSRFLFYGFDEVSDFKNVFEKKSKTINTILEEQADEVLKIYEVLKNRNEDINFDLAERQKKIFLDYFSSKQNIILDKEYESLGFISNIKRLALIFFRICMILTVYRDSTILSKTTNLICSNKDFLIALALMKTYFQHSLNNFKNFDQFSLSEMDEELLNLLADKFTTDDIYVVGKKLNLSHRTIHYKINKWRSNKIIKKLKKGFYQKL